MAEERLASASEPWKTSIFTTRPIPPACTAPLIGCAGPFESGEQAHSGHDHTYERLLVDGLPYL